MPANFKVVLLKPASKLQTKSTGRKRRASISSEVVLEKQKTANKSYLTIKSLKVSEPTSKTALPARTSGRTKKQTSLEVVIPKKAKAPLAKIPEPARSTTKQNSSLKKFHNKAQPPTKICKQVRTSGRTKKTSGPTKVLPTESKLPPTKITQLARTSVRAKKNDILKEVHPNEAKAPARINKRTINTSSLEESKAQPTIPSESARTSGRMKKKASLEKIIPLEAKTLLTQTAGTARTSSRSKKACISSGSKTVKPLSKTKNTLSPITVVSQKSKALTTKTSERARTCGRQKKTLGQTEVVPKEAKASTLNTSDPARTRGRPIKTSSQKEVVPKEAKALTSKTSEPARTRGRPKKTSSQKEVVPKEAKASTSQISEPARTSGRTKKSQSIQEVIPKETKTPLTKQAEPERRSGRTKNNHGHKEVISKKAKAQTTKEVRPAQTNGQPRKSTSLKEVVHKKMEAQQSKRDDPKKGNGRPGPGRPSKMLSSTAVTPMKTNALGNIKTKGTKTGAIQRNTHTATSRTDKSTKTSASFIRDKPSKPLTVNESKKSPKHKVVSSLIKSKKSPEEKATRTRRALSVFDANSYVKVSASKTYPAKHKQQLTNVKKMPNSKEEGKTARNLEKLGMKKSVKAKKNAILSVGQNTIVSETKVSYGRTKSIKPSVIDIQYNEPVEIIYLSNQTKKSSKEDENEETNNRETSSSSERGNENEPIDMSGLDIEPCVLPDTDKKINNSDGTSSSDSDNSLIGLNNVTELQDAATLEAEEKSTLSELGQKNTHLTCVENASSLNSPTKDTICNNNEGVKTVQCFASSTAEESTENDNPIQFTQSIEMQKEKEVGSIKSYLGSFF